MTRRQSSHLLLPVLTAGLLGACGSAGGGPVQLGDSWIRATGTDAARGTIDFAANALVVTFSGRQIVSAADGSGVGFSLSFVPDQVTPETEYPRLLGLTYRTKAGTAGAITPISGGMVRFSALGTSAGEPIEGTFTLDVDRPENDTFPRIQMQVTGSFRFLRR